jgi:pyruvate formate lyase activating enzyme
MVPWGYVAALQSDPIEKKPFFHVLPGSEALTFGMLGCDFHCSYCQNWVTSQAMRDSDADVSVNYVQPISPEQVAHYAHRMGAAVIASSYNEPLITSEWAAGIFRQALAEGLKCVFINGRPPQTVPADGLRRPQDDARSPPAVRWSAIVLRPSAGSPDGPVG